MVVAFDGESKCGKTTIINAVATEAFYQASVIPSLLDGTGGFSTATIDNVRCELSAFQEALTFNSISTISAGNMFRAAALYVSEEEKKGAMKESFDSSDLSKLRDLLAVDGIQDVLQEDPTIGRRVSSVAKMPGVQALCSSIFCDNIITSYHADGGGNLVIVDARNPVGAMQRNGIIGNGESQIMPGSILPIYIDTPTEVAAARMGGVLADKIEEVSSRRHMDATREELPVTAPEVVIDDMSIWLKQFDDSEARATVAVPYRLDNGEGVGLNNIQYFAGRIAVSAQDIACWFNFRGLGATL